MKIGLIAEDSKLPNYALMKIYAYHKSQGDEVDFALPFEYYDIIYRSKIFNFSQPDNGVYFSQLTIKGGTGYDIASKLPDYIDNLNPDYSLYPNYNKRFSLGFLTRGCPNKCKWCVVPTKEGAVTPYRDIDDITENGRRPYAILMDNNILASDYGLQQIKKIVDKGYHVDFNQALDARLITPEIANMLASAKWIGSIIRLGCDTHKQIEDCERAMNLIIKDYPGAQFLMYTMLSDDINESYERLSYFRNNKKVRIVAQPFRNPYSINTIPQWQKDMARWAMRREYYKSSDFKEFEIRKNFRCINHFKQ